MTDPDNYPIPGRTYLSAAPAPRLTPDPPRREPTMRIPAYAKTIVAGVVAVIGVVTPIIGQDDYLSTTDVVQMALGILTAFGVYVVPNAPQTPLVVNDNDRPAGL